MRPSTFPAVRTNRLRAGRHAVDHAPFRREGRDPGPLYQRVRNHLRRPLAAWNLAQSGGAEPMIPMGSRLGDPFSLTAGWLHQHVVIPVLYTLGLMRWEEIASGSNT